MQRVRQARTQSELATDDLQTGQYVAATNGYEHLRLFRCEGHEQFRLVEWEHQGLSRVIWAPKGQTRSKNQQTRLRAISVSYDVRPNFRLADEERNSNPT